MGTSGPHRPSECYQLIWNCIFLWRNPSYQIQLEGCPPSKVHTPPCMTVCCSLIPPLSQDSIRDLQRTLSARLQTRCSGRSCQILPSRVRAPRGHAIRLPTLAGVCWYRDSFSWHLSADDAPLTCPEKLLRQGLLLSTLNGAVSHAGLSLPIPSPLLVA